VHNKGVKVDKRIKI